MQFALAVRKRNTSVDNASVRERPHKCLRSPKTYQWLTSTPLVSVNQELMCIRLTRSRGNCPYNKGSPKLTKTPMQRIPYKNTLQCFGTNHCQADLQGDVLSQGLGMWDMFRFVGWDYFTKRSGTERNGTRV